MSHKTYFLVCGAIFFVVATAHLTRLIMGWEITIAGWDAPHWVSIPGLIIPGVLSAWGFVLALRSTRSLSRS
jgi:hypothetical protein